MEKGADLSAPFLCRSGLLPQPYERGLFDVHLQRMDEPLPVSAMLFVVRQIFLHYYVDGHRIMIALAFLFVNQMLYHLFDGVESL